MGNDARLCTIIRQTGYRIIADNNSHDNIAKLNGKKLTRSWFTHADIVTGGELYFRMSNKPNMKWASAKEGRPSSVLIQ